MKNKTVNVTIFGNTYTLSADTDEQRAHIENIAKMVDTRMCELSKNLSLTSVPKIAILTALNFASDLVESNETEKSSDHALELDQMIQTIDTCLIEE